MKHLISAILFAVALLSSCMSSKKYAVIVNEKLETTASPFSAAKYEEWLTIDTGMEEHTANSFNQLKSSFVPALVYWGWNSTIECALAPSLSANLIKNAIYKAADSLGLQQKLKGEKLTINLKQTPGQFLYENKGYTIFVLVAYSMGGSEGIIPAPIPLVAEYKVSNALAGSDMQITIKNNEQPMQNIWKSTKKFTWAYLDQYNKETDRMGTELVKGILQKLDN